MRISILNMHKQKHIPYAISHIHMPNWKLKFEIYQNENQKVNICKQFFLVLYTQAASGKLTVATNESSECGPQERQRSLQSCQIETSRPPFDGSGTTESTIQQLSIGEPG